MEAGDGEWAMQTNAASVFNGTNLDGQVEDDDDEIEIVYEEIWRPDGTN